MLPVNPIERMGVYASNSQYIQGPSPEQQAQGTIPLDTLPADWWNWLWKSITERINQASKGMESIYDEVMSVLAAASIEPSQLQSDQLLNAIKALARVTGTSAIAGAVKSSADSGKVSIDENGIMTVNGLGIPTSLNTATKNVVSAINEILLNYTNNKATTDAAITGLQNSKAPNNHASGETTYGTGTSSAYGHVKLYDGVDSDSGANSGVAATPAAVKALRNEMLNSFVTFPVGMVVPYAGASAPSGWLLCDGQAVSRTSYPSLFQVLGVTYGGGDGVNTFNVPDLRECSPIGVGQRGSGVSTHETYTLGQFKDDTFKEHNHSCSSTSNDHTHNFRPSGTIQVNAHSHGLNGHKHTFTPEGTVGNHSHPFTPQGTVSSSFSGINHSFYSPRADDSFDVGILGGENVTRRFDSSTPKIYEYAARDNDPSIVLQWTDAGTVSSSFVGSRNDTEGTSPSFVGSSGTTSGNNEKTTSETASGSFTGSAGTTEGQNNNHNHSIGNAGGNTTHGKHLGMNYIIKT